MTLAVVHSRALRGMSAPPVTVEVHLANGLPSFTLVGLADTEVKEARERVRAALHQSGFEFPFNKRITVSLAPADLPKESGRFDLPIAVGLLAAMGHLDIQRVATSYEFAGELSLGGDVRPVRGMLAMALAFETSADSAQRTLVLPQANLAEAALVGGMALCGVGSLEEAVEFIRSGQAVHAPVSLPTDTVLETGAPVPDLADVKGHFAAKRALEVAAAGGHSLLMVGPPGSGKSMLAQRLVGLLPPMSREDALASANVWSLAGQFDVGRWRQRVCRAPHHSASSVALVGGGVPARPGEISLAHGGVLFLDELPEFARVTLEALREPLEQGRIVVARARERVAFPARFQLVAAMNPCPCGYLGHPTRSCTCSPQQVARYQGKISGPLLDRLDLWIEVNAVTPQALTAMPQADTSEQVRSRVTQAQSMQWHRQGKLNARLDAHDLSGHVGSIGRDAMALLHRTAVQLSWSNRSMLRVMQVARTIADLGSSQQVQAPHLAEAIQYRRALIGAHK